MLNPSMLADYRQDMQQHHMKFFESVQTYLRPPSTSFSGTSSSAAASSSSASSFGNGNYSGASCYSHAGTDSAFGDEGSVCRPRSGSGGSFFGNGASKDELEHVPSDEFPPISTFHVASPSPRKQSSQHHYQQGPPRSNRFRRGTNGFRNRAANGSSETREMSAQGQRKARHDSYSSSEGVGFGTMTLQQQQAINSEASQGGQSADFVGRYKTELCRPFMENGECKYGDKCQFAHGRHELKQMSRHPKYKTEYCRTFHTVGFCPYGPRCHFLHLLDLDNPVQDDSQTMSDEAEQQSGGSTSSTTSGGGIKHPQQLALFEHGREDSSSPTTIDEPAESVFLSPSSAAVSPVSSLSSCSEAAGTASSSGIGLTSPNASVSSSNSPSSRNAEEPIIVNDAEFPPLRPLQTSTSDSTPSNAPSSLLTTASNPPVDRLHLLTISTGHQMQSESNCNSDMMNFAQLQQQKRQQQFQAAMSERCMGIYRRLPQSAGLRSLNLLPPPMFAGAVPIVRGQPFFPSSARRLPIFSSLAN